MLRVHSSIKNIHCEVCGKGVNSNVELKRHSYVHKDISERPFKCSNCEKRFCLPIELKSHQTTCLPSNNELQMKDTKKYFCTLCSKHYCSKQSLQEHHIRIHSPSKKRYKCEKCNYACHDYSSFSRHSYLHESRDTWPHECPNCKMKFILRAELKDHQQDCK